MASSKSKAGIGLALVILFVITLVSGLLLHLRRHGIIVEPRPAIWLTHCIAGFLMVAVAAIHGLQFKKILAAMKPKFRWFWADTWLSVIFIALAFLTGLIKLLSPVRIPNLGLEHYWFGMIMSLAVIVHLVRGIPARRHRNISGAKRL